MLGQLALAVLAGPTGEAAKAGPIGLVVILLLAVACFFLFRSMSKHLKRVRDDFPADGPERPPEPRPDEDAPPADENGTAQNKPPT